MGETGGKPRRRAGYPGAVPWIGFVAVYAALVFSLVSDKPLSADGVAHFIDTLQWGKFLQFDPTRAHAVYANTWTLVLAGRMDISQLDVLLRVYAAGLLLPAIVMQRRGIHLDRKTAAAISLFVLLNVADNVHGTLSWRDCRHEFVEVMRSGQGYVNFQETDLAAHPAGIEWNVALLSLAWSGGLRADDCSAAAGIGLVPGRPAGRIPDEKYSLLRARPARAPGRLSF